MPYDGTVEFSLRPGDYSIEVFFKSSAGTSWCKSETFEITIPEDITREFDAIVTQNPQGGNIIVPAKIIYTNGFAKEYEKINTAITT
jgi:hypothetical protein